MKTTTEIYFEAQEELRNLKEKLRQKKYELSDIESRKIILDFMDAIIERDLAERNKMKGRD